MELVIAASMLLFMGFCTVILVVAISNVRGESEGEESIAVTTPQTRHHDRDSRA